MKDAEISNQNLNPERRFLAFIWLTALLLNMTLWGLYYTGDSPKSLAGDEKKYFEVSVKLSQGEPVELSPLWPPGYYYLLSHIHTVSESMGVPFIFLAQLFQVLLWAVCGVFVWKISGKVLKGYSARLMAIGLFLLFPTLTAFSHYLWPEVVHLAIYLAVGWVLLFKPPSIAWNGLAGGLMAMAALLKLIFLLISILCLGLLFYRSYRTKSSLIPVGAASLIFVGLLLPTLSHNHQLHGRWMIADSSTINLWLGLNDKKLTDWGPGNETYWEFKQYLASAPSHQERNTIYRKKIKDYITEKGFFNVIATQAQKQYFRLFDHRTFFSKQLPGGMKPRYHFSDGPVAYGFWLFNAIMWAMILIGFGAGIWFLPWKQQPLWVILGLIVLYQLSLFLFLHVKTRYTLQFFPVLCLIAGTGYAQLISFITSAKDHRKPIHWWRVIGATFTVLLLLVFAFYGT